MSPLRASEENRYGDRPVTATGWLVGIVGVVVLIVAVIAVFGYMLSWHATAPSTVCVVKQGGPFDGRDVKEVRPGGEGVKSIGIWNHQYCFPTSQRNYIVSSNPNESDSKTTDFVTVQTKDAQTVHPSGQALFTLNDDPAVVKNFYLKFGTRTFDGKHAYDGGEGWDNFLKIQFRPILDNALREAIGSFSCTQLNNSCQYVVQAQKAANGEVQQVDTTFNLNSAQTQIEKILTEDLNNTLGGNFFTGIKWRFAGGQGGAIAFTGAIQDQIQNAQAAQTKVATARLQAASRVEKAKGDTSVAHEQSLQIAEKSKAYKSNPQQAEIDKLKALCGENGCSNLQVLGGSATKILK